MNTDTLKQQLLNNLWFGENYRRSEHLPELWGSDGYLISVFAEPDFFRVWGTDHSGRWDGNVNFVPMVEMGAKFTFLKCIDGTVPSPLYYENRDRARSAGLLTGPYGWLYRNKDVPGRAQAQACWERIKNEKKQLPAVIDFEWTKFLGQWSNPTYEDLRIYGEEFNHQSGYKPILYSAPGYMNPMGPIPKTILELFEGMWDAHYGAATPQLPMGINNWIFHQFASTGNARVISPNDAGKEEVDLNYCKDLQTLFRLAGITEPLPDDEEEPMPGTETYLLTVVTAALNIRAGAGVNYAITVPAGLIAGDKVESTSRTTLPDGSVWYRIAKITRGTLPVPTTGNGWASSGLNGSLMRLEILPPTPEPTPTPTLPAYFTAHGDDGTELGRYNLQ